MSGTEPLFTLTPIAYVRSCFKEKFGVPRQAGLAPAAEAELVIQPPYDDPGAFAELAGCSHLWLQFVFHENSHYRWQPRIRAPRLGGNRTLGVFASRSPYRPNALGLSAVRLLGIERRGAQLVVAVAGADLVDGTPIVDIKPYVPYADRIDAVNPIAAAAPRVWPVKFTEAAQLDCNRFGRDFGKDIQALISQVLGQRPVPAFHGPSERIYGCRLWDINVRFRVRRGLSGATGGVLVDGGSADGASQADADNALAGPAGEVIEVLALEAIHSITSK